MVTRTAKLNSDRREATEPPATKSQTVDPQHYDRLDLLPIAGEWRHGRAENRLVDANPYTNDVLLEIKQADRNDLDAAFAGAKAQVEWAASSAGGAGARISPRGRGDGSAPRRNRRLADQRIRQPQIKANLEWEVTHTVMLGPARCRMPSKAASFRPTFRTRKIRCGASRSAWSARSARGTGHCI